jgi:2-oxoglutarate dehydrogenase E2 component (dihydrolipoamide succinyltransferase)
MTVRSKLSVTLVLALSAVAATSFAYVANNDPHAASPVQEATAEEATDVDEHAMAPAEEAPAAPAPVAPAPAEPAAPQATGNPAPVPHIEHYSMPSTVVTAPRPSDDELLRTAVVDRLAADPRLSGRIGVETFRHVVSLTGRVTTTGQRDRAESIARSVDGVWDVENFIRTRVGES